MILLKWKQYSEILKCELGAFLEKEYSVIKFCQQKKGIKINNSGIENSDEEIHGELESTEI